MVYAESMFCYEHYRMQITSKIDHFGRMKHIINGKPIKLNLRESIKSNLALIETLGNELGVLMK